MNISNAQKLVGEIVVTRGSTSATGARALAAARCLGAPERLPGSNLRDVKMLLKSIIDEEKRHHTEALAVVDLATKALAELETASAPAEVAP